MGSPWCWPGAAGAPTRRPEASAAAALAPEAKVAATLAFTLAVVATPREAVWAFAVDAALLGVVVAVVRLRPGPLLRAARVEVPFLVFAASLAFLGTDPRTEVAGLSLSTPGLWAGWNIAVKGTLGVGAALVLRATTAPSALLLGLQRLGVPRLLVAIAGSMVRYLEVLTDEVARLRIARVARGDDPRWLWQARAVAAGAGTLFVRSYERGERVHLAMLARGGVGGMPDVGHRAAPREWAVVAVVPLVAAGAALTAVLA